MTTVLLIGAVIWAYLGMIFEILTETVAWERWEGTIEYTFMAPLSRPVHLTGMGIFADRRTGSFGRCSCSRSSRSSSTSRFPGANFAAALVVLAVASISFVGIGMMTVVLPLISPGERDAARVHRAGDPAGRLGRLLPGRPSCPSWMQCALHDLACHLRARRHARRDPRRATAFRSSWDDIWPLLVIGAIVDPARPRRLPPRRAVCEAAREAEAVGVRSRRGPGVHSHPSFEATRPRADGGPGLFAFKEEVRRWRRSRPGRATSDPAARKDVLKRVKDEEIELRPPLVHGHRGAPEELRGHAAGARGRARRRDGLRRLVDHGLQRDRGVGHGRDPRPGHLPADAERWPQGRADDLRRRHSGRRALRGRPAPRPAPRPRAHGEHGLRHVQRRPGARVLPLQGRRRHRDARRGRLLRHDDDGRGQRPAPRHRHARSSRWGSRSSTSTTRSAPLSTRSTCSSPTRSRWPTTRSRTGSSSRRSPRRPATTRRFMPKPIFGENGSGMHTHQSLFSDGKNAFFDADDEWSLSEVGKGFIAGQLRHAREISAVFAQWVNSYKRLVPGYEAPVYAAWSRRNRSALIRIPLYKPGNEQATRAEIRCPDPACNPYLTFAALLHAGLEGIEQGYELPPPMESNLYKLTRGGAKGARHRRAAGDARRGDRRAGRVRPRPPGARRPHLRQLRRSSSGRSGTSTASSSPRGSWRSTCRSCRTRPLGVRLLSVSPLLLEAGD